MATRSRKTSTKRKTPAKSSLYLGCFYFDEPGETERSGSFQIVVEASSPEQAIDRFRKRLQQLRDTTTLFNRPVTIFIEGFIKLGGSFKRGLLVNWDSGQAPLVPNVRLTCLIPEQTDHKSVGYGFDPEGDPDNPQDDEVGKTIAPFLDFGGEALREALREEAPNAATDAPGYRSGLLGGISPAGRATVEAAKNRCNDDKEAKEREAAQARRERKRALASTVAELRAANKQPARKKTATRSKKAQSSSTTAKRK